MHKKKEMLLKKREIMVEDENINYIYSIESLKEDADKI